MVVTPSGPEHNEADAQKDIHEVYFEMDARRARTAQGATFWL